jgi:Secretion system C-terminal sorting domain
MKNFSVFILLFIACISNMSAQTTVSGSIYSNTTWTLANSPYIMTGSVVIFPGKTLTIEPGVQVRVQGNSTNTGLQLYLEVRGTLNAVGTPTAPISFISDIPNETYYTWNGINIKGDQGGTVNMNYFTLKNTMYGINNNIASYDTLALKGCNFMYNNYAIFLNTNVKLDSSFFRYNGVGIGVMMVFGSVTARNCVFDNNFANMTTIPNGMYLYNSSFTNGGNAILGATGIIDNCLFDNNDVALQESGGLTITNTIFTNNGTAIKGLTGSTVQNCTFNYNDVGLEIADNSMIENNFLNNNGIGLALAVNTPGQLVSNVKNNQICQNTLYNVENRTNVNLGLEQNCFCESDSTIIETKIYDGYDDITRGLINYAIYDSSCQSVLRYIEKVNLGTSSIDKREILPQFTISPNPSSAFIWVKTENAKMFNSPLQIIDMNGRTVKSNLSYLGGEAVINIQDLPLGVYMIIEEASFARKMFVKR